MSKNILFAAHVDESGNTLPKSAYEALGAALELAERMDATVTVGLVGENIRDAANSLASADVRIIGVSGPDFANPRYSTDAAAVEAICRKVPAEIVIAPATSRFLRVMPGVAQRLKGQVDTHITSVEVIEGVVSAKR